MFRSFFPKGSLIFFLPGIALGLFLLFILVVLGGASLPHEWANLSSLWEQIFFTIQALSFSFMFFYIGFIIGSFPGVVILFMYSLRKSSSKPAVERSPYFFYQVYFTVVGLTLFIVLLVALND